MASQPKSVLFVCLGNICRSPMAEAVFRHLVKEAGALDQWHIDSAGTGDWHIGHSPDKRGRKCMESHGLSSSHKARLVQEEDFRCFDHILCMDDMNLKDLTAMRPADATASLDLLGTFDPEGQDIIVDPFKGEQDDFESVYQQCLRCCKSFLQQHH